MPYTMRSPLRRRDAKAIANNAIKYLSNDDIKNILDGDIDNDGLHNAIGKELDWANGYMFSDIKHYVNKKIKEGKTK